MKILLLDAAFNALPIYESLLYYGHEVLVMGNRHDDVLAQKAGKNWINQDYSRVSEVRAHIEELCIDYVVPGCTDVSMETYCQLDVNFNEQDKLAKNLKLNNKIEFRLLCQQLDIPAPRLISREVFPIAGLCICKPVDSFSGNGITVFDGSDIHAAEEAYRTAIAVSRSSSALFETYQKGDLYSCSVFIENQKFTDSFYVREGSSVNPYAVDTSYVDTIFPKKIAMIIEESLEKLVRFLRLGDGLLHAQFILQNERPFFIEMTRRCPGDLYSLLIEYSTGYPYAAKYASYFYNSSLISERKVQKYILRHTVATKKDIILQGIEFYDPTPVRAYFPINHMGQSMRSGQKDRAGLLFAEVDTHEELLIQYDKFISREAYRL